MSTKSFGNLEEMQFTIDTVIAENNGRQDVMEVLRILGKDRNFLPSLVQKMTNKLEEHKEVGLKNSQVARDHLFDACHKLNAEQPNLVEIFALLNQVLLYAPPDEKFVPSVFRLQAVLIHLLPKNCNPRGFVDFADELDPTRNDEILAQVFGLKPAAFHKFGKFVDIVRGFNSPTPSIDDESFYVNSSLQLCTNNERGQHYVATERIFPEQLIFKEKLFAVAIPPEKAFELCSGCFSSSTVPILFPCDRCCEAAFCSLQCKATACLPEGVHARECGIKQLFDEFCHSTGVANVRLNYFLLSRFDPKVFVSGELDNVPPYTAVQFMADQFIPTGDEGLQKRRQKRLLKYIQSMAFYSGQLCQDEFVNLLIQSCHLAMLWLIQSNQVEKLTAAQKFQLINEIFVGFLRLDVNCFQLSTENDPRIGPSLVLFASRFNHSCAKNAKWKISNGVFKFTTTKLIEIGDEIFVNYLGCIPKISNFDIRQEKLLLTYNLHCDCKECKTQLYSTDKVLLACNHCQGPVYFVANELDTDRCRQCSRNFTNDIFYKAQGMVIEFLKQCRSQEPASSDVLVTFVEMFDALSKMLYHKCYTYLHILNLTGSFYSKQQSMDKSLLEVASEIIRLIPSSLKFPVKPYEPNGDSIPVAAMKVIYEREYKHFVSIFEFWIYTTKGLAGMKSLSAGLRTKAKDIFDDWALLFAEFIDHVTGPEFEDLPPREKDDVKEQYRKFREELNF